MMGEGKVTSASEEDLKNEQREKEEMKKKPTNSVLGQRVAVGLKTTTDTIKKKSQKMTTKENVEKKKQRKKDEGNGEEDIRISRVDLDGSVSL